MNVRRIYVFSYHCRTCILVRVQPYVELKIKDILSMNQWVLPLKCKLLVGEKTDISSCSMNVSITEDLFSLSFMSIVFCEGSSSRRKSTITTPNRLD